MTQRLLCLLLATTLLGACSTGGPDRIDFSVKQLALDLVFSEEALKQPVPPKVILQYLPAPAEVVVDRLEPIELRPVKQLCPVAPEGTPAKLPAKLVMESAPAVGSIGRHNQGSVKISAGTLNLSLPFPPRSAWVTPAVDEVPITDALGNETGKTFEWDVRKEWYPGFVQVDRFRLAPNSIQLVRRETVIGESSSVFVPSPPIDFFQFEVEGTEWRNPAIDRENGTAMLWEGLVEKREVVDVCGEIVDTWRFSVRQTTINLADGSVSGTADGKRDVYNIAIQYGGLVVREEIHQRITVREESTGVPLFADLDYTSVADRTTPEGSAP